MSWYRTGTVAVTISSKTVTGTGTLWSVTVQPGDAFVVTDANGLAVGGIYEVAAVNSNTSLTLYQNYQGTTASGLAYAVLNMAGDQTTASFANRLSQFFDKQQALLNAPGVNVIKVGGVTFSPDAVARMVEFVAGAGVTLTPSAAGKTVTIAGTQATESALGTVELATAAEVAAGTDAVRAVTPAALAGSYATNAEALAGTTKKIITAESLRYVTLNTLYNIEQAPAYCGVSSEGGWHRIKEDGTPFYLRHDIDNAKGIHRAFTHLAPWAGIETRIITSSAGPQQVVRIPKFWYKRQGTGLAGDPYKLWISGVERSGYVLHPAFAVVDEFFVGAFACGGDKYESVEGLNPKTNITIGTAQSGITTNHGAGWNMWDIYQLSALQMLYLVEFGDPDAQKLIGAGNGSSNDAIPNGKTNAVYRGIHEFWGNVWQMVDGLRGYSGTTEAEIFRADGSRVFVRTGITPPASYSGSSMLTNAGTGFDLKAVNMYGPAGQAHFSDDYWGPVNNFMTLHGGCWIYGSVCGVFCLCLGLSVSFLSLSIGSRLAKV